MGARGQHQLTVGSVDFILRILERLRRAYHTIVNADHICDRHNPYRSKISGIKSKADLDFRDCS